METAVQQITRINKIKGLLKSCRQAGHAVAIWRLPESEAVIANIEMGRRNSSEEKIEEIPAGFILAPFSPDEKFRYIYSDITLNLSQDNISDSLKDHPELKERFDQVIMEPEPEEQPQAGPVDTTEEHRDYVALVQKAVSYIKENKAKKVVLARKNTLKRKTDGAYLFDKLLKAYSSSFVYLVYHPEMGTWCGATPELLVSKDTTNTFRTVALAGTQPHTGRPLKKVGWTQKEIEEQAIVSRYIISCFKHIRLREFEEDGPKTARAGNLLHLKTDFLVNMDEVKLPDLTGTMLKLLHPTSAVCGMPRESSYEFLKKNENINRGLYSGYIGPVNQDGNTGIFVNLRCANLHSDHVDMFAGAGITEDSDPEMEFKETEMKLEVVRRYL